MKINYLLSAFAATTAFVSAATISVNFTDNGSADSTMGLIDVAGAPAASGARVSNWNNVTANGASQAAVTLGQDSEGNAITTTVAYTGTGAANWRLGHTITNGDDRLWKGYLDTATEMTISVTDVPYAIYDVIVYFDGENAGDWRVASYAIGAVSAGGEDSENTSWGFGQNVDKVYQLPDPSGNANGNKTWPQPTSNNGEGNYVILTGITGSSFDLIASAGGSASAAKRAPINGFQIVQVPEPSAAALLGLGSLALFLRRRK